MSTYCIGDVHGCLRTLQALLAAINYRAGQDRLWFTGDLVDRGPDSVGVLQLLRELPDVVAVMGNHDFHLLAYYFGGIASTKASYQKILDTPGIEECIPWLLKRPFIYCDEKLPWVLVHAGIFPGWSVVQAMQYGQELKEILRQYKGKQLATFLRQAYGNCAEPQNRDASPENYYAFLVNVFTRMRYCKADGSLDLEMTGHPRQVAEVAPDLTPWFCCANLQLGQSSSNDGILFGHWAALKDSLRRERLICLDSGCSWGEKLAAYCIESGEFYEMPNQDGYQNPLRGVAP